MEKVASGKNGVLEVVKAIIVALIISLVLILVMAFVIKMAGIDNSYLAMIIQIIKAVSILVASLICLRIPSDGWVKGIVIGIVYTLLAFVVFSLLDGGFSVGLGLLTDVAIGAVVGMISGIISVVIRK